MHEIRAVDCLDPERGLPGFPDKSFDHCITDPPFAEQVHENQVSGTSEKFSLSFSSLASVNRIRYAREIIRVTRGWLLVFTDVESIGEWKQIAEAHSARYRRSCVWIKTDAQPQISGDRPAQGFEPFLAIWCSAEGRSVWNGGGRVGTYFAGIPKGPERFHETQKPLDLMEQLVKDFTRPGETVLDPFAGSGTTACAAKKWARRSVSFEIDQKYAKAAQERLERQAVVLDAPHLLEPRGKRAKQMSMLDQ